MKQTIMKKTSLSLLLILLFAISNAQSNKGYYKDFYDDIYEPYVQPNELLGDQIGLKNKTSGKITLKAKYDDVISMNEKYVRVISNNKWGIVDTVGNVVIPIVQDFCTDMDQNRIYFRNSTRKYALANSTGVLLTKYIFEDISYFTDGLAGVKSNDLWGFINKQGTVVIPFRYSYVSTPTAGKINVKTTKYETYILGTLQEAGKPWTERPNDVTIQNINNYVINYSGKAIFTSKDDIQVLKDGYILTSSKWQGCKLDNNWENIELYDQNLKKLIGYKACWSCFTFPDYIIVKNGTSERCGIVKIKNRQINGADLLKTPYLKHEKEPYYDDDKQPLLKFYLDEERFIFIDIEGNCVEREGSEKCE